MGGFRRIVLGKRDEPLEKVHHIIVVVIRIILALAAVGAIADLRWPLFFIVLLNFLATFLPRLVERRYRIDIPIEFEILVILFVFASLFLGEARGYYTEFWWWDIILHIGAGVALGFVGFGILYVLDRSSKIKARPLTIAIFAFCFAMAIGAVWEIFEFSMDQLFGLNMQKSGLVDTMWDLIVDAAGALFASVIGFLYLKREDGFIINRIIERFVRDNPNLFKKKNAG